MAGYTRQSVADIIANAVIKAAPVNAEFNALRDAFAAGTGHKHDGTSAEGAFVPILADLDGNNKVVVDTANNRISVFVEVGGSPVEQLRIQDGVIVPVTDNDIDLGTSSLEFKNLYIDGIAKIDTLTVDENATIAGTLGVTGATTLNTITSNVTPTTDDTYDLGTVTNEWRNLYVDGTANIDSLAADAAAVSGNATVGGTMGITGTTSVSNINASGNLGVTGTATLATVDINAGAIDGTTIGASSAAAGTFTAVTASGTATLATVDINAGAIDGTTIGASTAAAGSFTTVTTSGQATLATADINGGTIDGAVIGGATPAAVTGTTITANTGFVGPLTGAVTGNVTGNLTGNVTGNVTGDLTGNVTAASGTSTFNDVTINGGLNMNAGTAATITNLTTPVSANDAATKGYVDTSISNLVDSAPAALDTLNELAAALGDDANFSTTITNSIATKLPLAGGTMSGAIAMGTNKITGLGDPTANQDAATKVYVDTQDALKLSLSGGTMTGAIDMGANKITTTYTPTDNADLTTKTYVDSILGSATAAATSAAAAATSASNAATSETNAGNSASAAAASFDSFDDRYLGAKSSAPATDNDGDPLITGALYFDTTANLMKVYDGSAWVDAGSAVNGTSERNVYTATGGQTSFASTYDVGFVDVYLNGVKLIAGTDFTATDGLSVVLATGATAGDTVDIVAYGAFNIADTYTQAQADARFVNVTGDTMTGNLDVQGTVTADGLTVESSGEAAALFKGYTSVTGVNAVNNGEILFGNNPSFQGRISYEGQSVGVLYIENSYNDDAADIVFRSKSAGTAQNKLLIDGNGDILFYEDTGTTPKMVWKASDERLGIGTSSPSALLHVEAADGAAGGAIKYTSTGVASGYMSADGAGLCLATDTAGITFRTGVTGNDPTDTGSERLRITSAGNVGIGTSSPADLLHVKGSTAVVGDYQIIVEGATGGYGAGVSFQSPLTGGSLAEMARITADGEAAWTTTGSTQDAGLRFYTALDGTVAERLRIDSSGNVGIGTSSPAHKLDVAGELIADSYNETFVTLSGTTPAVNCETGNVFALTTSGNTTFTFTNPPASGTAYGFTLKVTAGGTHTLTWPASVDWAGGTAPDAPASGETNMLVFITHDGGTTWYGFQAGAAMA